MGVRIYVAIEGQGTIIDASYEGKYLADCPEFLDKIAKARGISTIMSFLGDEPTTDNWDNVLATTEKNRWFQARDGVETFKAILAGLQQAQFVDEDWVDEDEDWKEGLFWTLEGVIHILETAQEQGKRFHLVGSW